jgi:hypothetical protein
VVRVRQRPRWIQKHVTLLVAMDAAAAAAATGLAILLQFNGDRGELVVREFTVSYSWLAVAIVPTWLACLALTHCYDIGPFGTAVRSRQVVRAGANFLAVVALAYFVLQVENLRRGFFVAAVPLALLFSLGLRRLATRFLRLRRRQGDGVRRAIIVGSRPTVSAVVRRLGLRRGAELSPVGACLPDPGEPLVVNNRHVPVHDLDDVLDAVEESGADAVVLTGSLAHGRIQRLTWALEGTGIDVFVVPALAQSAIELDVRPVAGLPLVYVDQGRTPPEPLAPPVSEPPGVTPANAGANGYGVNGTPAYGTPVTGANGATNGVANGTNGVATGTGGVPTNGSSTTHRARDNRGVRATHR